MRFLHTSDWHLGRIFYGRHLTGEQEYLLEQLHDLVRQERPDAVVVAGDVFDRAVPPVEAINLLDDALYRLVYGLKVPVLLIAGNHDSPDRLGFGSRMLETSGLHVFGLPGRQARWVTLCDEHGPVVFCPLPYAEPPFVREALGEELAGQEEALAALVRRSLSGAPQGRRVAVAHAFIAGGQVSESERPLSVGGSGAVPAGLFEGFCYTALGHLHRPQQAGGERLRYSGSLMKYSFDEVSHRKAALMVELDGQGTAAVREFELKPRLDVRCVTGTLRDLLAAAATDPRREDFLEATLLDEGAVFDAMGQLRQAYPNVMAIKRAFVQPDGRPKGLSGDYRAYTDVDLFCEFYRQVTQKELNEEGAAALKQVLEEVRGAGEGAI